MGSIGIKTKYVDLCHEGIGVAAQKTDNCVSRTTTIYMRAADESITYC